MAHEAANPFLHVGAPTLPPRGFTEMCGALPGLCRSFSGMGEKVSAPALAVEATYPPLSPPGLTSRDGAPRWHLACRADGFADLAPTCNAQRAVVGAGKADEGGAVSWVNWRSERGPAAPLVRLGLESGGLSGHRGPERDGFALSAGLAPALAEPSLLLQMLPLAMPPLQPPALSLDTPLAASEGVFVSEPDSPPVSGALAGEAWRKLLRRVNGRVNARVHQQSDLATYGVAELWRPSGDAPGAVGDCEDLALQKRVELIASHFPADRLFLAVVYREGVGLHTVLVARLNEGDVVLDSRVDFIEPWHRAGYSWLSVETPGEPQVWREVSREAGAA